MNLNKAKSSSKVLTEKTVADLNLLQKLKPRQINIEKERLYEENLELKLKNNSLKEEILILKTKVQQMKKELVKKDDNDEKNAYSVKPANLLSNLKAKIKDLKSQVQVKTEEIEALQKNLKSSKIHEQEKEIAVYAEECNRLKHLLEETMGPNETLQKILTEKHSDINSVIESINKENKDLHKNLSFYKSELEKCKQKLFETEKRKKLPDKAEMKTLKKEIVKSKELNESLSKSLYEASNKEKGFRDEILKLKKVIKDIQHRYQGLEVNLKEAQVTISQLKGKSDSKTENLTQETSVFGQVESMPLMVKTVRLALNRANVSLDSFLETLDKSKSGNVTFDDFSQSLQKLGTYLTNSHFNSVPSACNKAECLIDLTILAKLIKDSQKILLIDSKDQTPIINTFDFESPVHVSKPPLMFPKNIEENSPQKKNMKIAIFPPVDNTKQVNSDSCKHSKRSKSKKLENFVSDDDSKSRGKRSSKTSDQQKRAKRKSRDSDEKSFSNISQEQNPGPEVLKAFSHIRMRMQLNRLPKSKLLITLFGAVDKEKSIKSQDLQAFLQKSPFSFKSEPETSQLLQYLITPSSTIKSVGDKLTSLLLDWEIFSPEDEELFDYQLGLIISKNKETFKEMCKLLDTERKGCIQISEFERILQELGISVPENLWSYMKLLFYSNDFQLDLMPYRYFIKAYGNPIEDHQEFSTVSENGDSQVFNIYLSAINTAMLANSLTIADVFDCDDDGLIFTEQFIEGLKKLGFEEIDERQVSVLMEALRYQGSYELCLNIEEMNDILQNLALGRLSQTSGSMLEIPTVITEMNEEKKFGVIKLMKADSLIASPLSF